MLRRPPVQRNTDNLTLSNVKEVQLYINMTINECLQLYIAHFEYQLKWRIYSTIWLLHGWCHAKLLPSRHMSCAPHTTITQCYLKPHIIMFIWSLSACWVISVLAESTNLWHQQKDLCACIFIWSSVYSFIQRTFTEYARNFDAREIFGDSKFLCLF